MSITCSRCQAENNDTKFACWNCWAVLPRLLTEENLLEDATKGKGNKKTSDVIEPIDDEPLDITAIVPPQPEQKKGGIFCGFGKKKTTEEPTPVEELTDMFADFEPEKMDTITTADTTENEDIFAPISENVESPEIIEIAPEPVKEKKGLFGFGSKKTTPVITPEDTTLFPEKGEIPKPEKKPLFGFGKNKADDIQPVKTENIDIIPTPIVEESSFTVIPEVRVQEQPLEENFVVEPIIIKDVSPEIIHEIPTPEIINNAVIENKTSESEVPFDFDFKAEVEKIFGGTNQDSTIPIAPQPNKPKRIRPIREEDGGLKRPKRPQ